MTILDPKQYGFPSCSWGSDFLASVSASCCNCSTLHICTLSHGRHQHQKAVMNAAGCPSYFTAMRWTTWHQNCLSLHWCRWRAWTAPACVLHAPCQAALQTPWPAEALCTCRCSTAMSFGAAAGKACSLHQSSLLRMLTDSMMASLQGMQAADVAAAAACL